MKVAFDRQHDVGDAILLMDASEWSQRATEGQKYVLSLPTVLKSLTPGDVIDPKRYQRKHLLADRAIVDVAMLPLAYRLHELAPAFGAQSLGLISDIKLILKRTGRDALDMQAWDDSAVPSTLLLVFFLAYQHRV